MSFWDDISDVLRAGLPIAGAVGGGIVGGMSGNPIAGAALGSSLGGRLGGMFGSDSAITDPAQARLALWNQLASGMPAYEGPKPGQGLTAADMAAFQTARNKTAELAHGREEALRAQDAASGGQVAGMGKSLLSQQLAGQGAMERGNAATLDIAGEAANRDRANRMALNEFNQRNMMIKAGIVGGQGGALGNIQGIAENQQARDQAKYSNLFGDLGAAGYYASRMGKSGGGAGVPNPDAFSGVSGPISPDYFKMNMGDFDPGSLNRKVAGGY